MNCWWNIKSIHFSVLQFSFLFIGLCTLTNSLPTSSQQVQLLCHDQEKSSLLHFKHSFQITCLASHSAFAFPKTRSWWDSSSNGTYHTSDCCLWDGVKCNEETGHVIGLDLSSSCLYGTFPRNTTLFGLDHLRELDLSDNNFNFSQIPSAIGRFSMLTELNLSQSSFMGEIPFEITQLSHLSILDLSKNYNLEFQHEMSFEKFVSNLTHITKLHLKEVNISSVVPAVLSNFTSLKSLILITCQLYGTFPSGVFQLPKLEVIGLSYNVNLRGQFPEFTTNSPLRTIEILGTPFSGELTPSIGNLGNLTGLSLRGTNIAGPIPSSLGNLTKLSFLQLSGNFDGDLPLPITNLTQLSTLVISYIQLSSRGSHILNSWLPKLRKIERLGLLNLTLTGEIPPALANYTRLSWLNLRLNNLTDPLPLWLANKTALTYLALDGNKFQGPIIPQWFSQLINLETLLQTADGSVARFETLLKLPYLSTLVLSGFHLIFPSNLAGTNSSFPKFGILGLMSCNIAKFPQFLRYQNELQLLDLSSNNIEGTIPQWFVNTTAKSLLGLSFADNHLTGFELSQTFLPWSNLEVIYISNNNFRGKLLSPPTSLRYYQVSGNKMHGNIPSDICNASSMTFLDLSMNNFSGHIPDCIGPQLSASLEILNLRGNRFEGPIPQSFTRPCKIKMINLSDNQLDGQLPKSLTNCESLEVLDVGKNELNDTFPSWLGSIPKLQVLVLRHNKFHGRIAAPKSGHPFSSLRIIDISNNFHVGNLPASYLENWLGMIVSDEVHQEYSHTSDFTISASDSAGMTINENIWYTYVMTIIYKGSERFYPGILTVFRVIDLSSNNFTGEIPDIIGNLKGLQALNLSNNHLIGCIPASLANLTDLEALDLSQNMLSGGIPQKFSKVTTLEIFNVSHNHLVGQIPQGEQFNTFDNSSFEGNLALCGAPLSNECRKTDSIPPVDAKTDRTEDSELIEWIFRSMGCVGGCILGFVIGKVFITDPYDQWFVETFGRRKKASNPRLRRLA